jgi:hypothetical protein
MSRHRISSRRVWGMIRTVFPGAQPVAEDGGYALYHDNNLIVWCPSLHDLAISAYNVAYGFLKARAQ